VLSTHIWLGVKEDVESLRRLDRDNLSASSINFLHPRNMLCVMGRLEPRLPTRFSSGSVGISGCVGGL
jgi:hypothetical protein